MESIAKYQERLREQRQDVTRFLDREFTALLAAGGTCRALDLKLTDLGVGIRHLRCAFAGAGEFAEPLVLLLQEQSGWLTARTSLPAWYDRLRPEQARSLSVAVSGLYKMCGVELVLEEIENCFGPDAPSYEVCEDGLLVQPDPTSDAFVSYDLRHSSPRSALVSPTTPSSLPTVDRRRLLFAAAPISWVQWVEHWQRDERRETTLPVGSSG